MKALTVLGVSLILGGGMFAELALSADPAGATRTGSSASYLFTRP